eukprot:Opistho-2@93138
MSGQPPLCQNGYVYYKNLSTCVSCAESVSKAVIGTFCNGTESVYPCSKGMYCPTVSQWIPCPAGSICREGSFEPSGCFGGRLTCGEEGLGECANFLPATVLFAALFIGVWIAIHVILSLIESHKQKQSTLHFQITSRTIHDLTLAFPYAMRWRRKTLVRRKRTALGMQQELKLSRQRIAEVTASQSSIGPSDLSQSAHGKLSRTSLVTSMPEMVQTSKYENGRRFSDNSIRLPAYLQDSVRRSLLSLADKVRAVRMEAVTADAFSDIPHSRAFKHALRRLHEPPASMDIEMEQVSVAADPAHAAKLANDETGGERPVVKDVSCTIRAGKFTAIMGPSGCGKSTLLKALAAAGEGPVFVAGGIKYGGEARPLSKPLPDMCFMPQESVIYPDLTADETVRYARLLSKGPFMAFDSEEANTPYDATDELVDEVLDVLGLGGVRGRIVGAEDGAEGERSAVSGGQRRRIVLAMEIVKRPSTLLLDEPTSGLDSTSTLVVMRALRDLANNGTTVIAVIHQPGYRVFKMVDDLVLLTGQGTLAYNGEAAGVLPYLEEIGYPRPIHASTPEFALDVAVGLARRKGVKKPDGAEFAAEILAEKWKVVSPDRRAQLKRRGTKPHLSRSTTKNTLVNHLPKLTPKKTTSEVTILVSIEAIGDKLDAIEAARNLYEMTNSKRRGDTHLRQFAIVTLRTILQLARGRKVLLIDGMLMVLMSLAINLIYGDLAPFDQASQHSALGLTLGLTGVIVGLRIFGADRHVYQKEKAAGILPIPYYLGKIIGSLPLIFVNPFILALSFCLIVSPRAPLAEYFVAFLLTQWAAMSIGVLASLLFRRKIALPVSVLYILIAFLCNSVTQKEKELEDKLGSFGTFLSRVSLLSYGTKALMFSELTRYPPVWAEGVTKTMSLIGFGVPVPGPFHPDGDFAPAGVAWRNLCLCLFLFAFIAHVLGGISIYLSSFESLDSNVLMERLRVMLRKRRRQRNTVAPGTILP